MDESHESPPGPMKLTCYVLPKYHGMSIRQKQMQATGGRVTGTKLDKNKIGKTANS
jgi:hypothetical protein